MTDTRLLKYRYAEAYCLLVYRSDDGTEQETVWNSRDGVSPFLITLRSGALAMHEDWDRDRFAPEHRPKPGDRVLVDMTRERHYAAHLAQALRYWDDDASGSPELREAAQRRWPAPEAMAREMADQQWRPGIPDLVEVPAEGWV